jgi:hypothetical protein
MITFLEPGAAYCGSQAKLESAVLASLLSGWYIDKEKWKHSIKNSSFSEYWYSVGLASNRYDESDYYRDYAEFIRAR